MTKVKIMISCIDNPVELFQDSQTFEKLFAKSIPCDKKYLVEALLRHTKNQTHLVPVVKGCFQAILSQMRPNWDRRIIFCFIQYGWENELIGFFNTFEKAEKYRNDQDYLQWAVTYRRLDLFKYMLSRCHGLNRLFNLNFDKLFYSILHAHFHEAINYCLENYSVPQLNLIIIDSILNKIYEENEVKIDWNHYLNLLKANYPHIYSWHVLIEIIENFGKSNIVCLSKWQQINDALGAVYEYKDSFLVTQLKEKRNFLAESEGPVFNHCKNDISKTLWMKFILESNCFEKESSKISKI